MSKVGSKRYLKMMGSPWRKSRQLYDDSSIPEIDIYTEAVLSKLNRVNEEYDASSE